MRTADGLEVGRHDVDVAPVARQHLVGDRSMAPGLEQQRLDPAVA